MEQIYIVMLIALAIMAMLDLVVGVSNDAVNFLNSAIGSKAVSFKTVMIVASLGVLLGALFSSGMMEIARSGIFNPSMFSFHDVMIIFCAVMITDILLLDVFNSLGLPTSTTVSIIFELLGASVCLAIYKIYIADGDYGTLMDYINTEKASGIVFSILLSVFLSFGLGSIVQYVSRLLFTFQYENKLKYFGSVFGGIAITAISFFILIKGLKGVSFITKDQYQWITEHQMLIIGFNFLFFTLLSQLLISVFKVQILKVVILIGTFALALAFAGNDLVNFIGVPIAAIQSYDFFIASGLKSNEYMMDSLKSNDIVAPIHYLLIAGIIMVITLWTSKKARSVVETGVNLSRQGDGAERFDSTKVSRSIVRTGVNVGKVLDYFIPNKLQEKIDQRFEKPVAKKKIKDEPAFDMIRASINLVVASILISIGTSLKLPLSTTYVTFMVAMGSSFADRAWDRESAVYRVAGVFNVIGGWFVTAIVAFLAASIVAIILKLGNFVAFVGMIILVAILLYRNAKSHSEKVKQEQELLQLKREDIVTISEIMNESSEQISKVISKTNHLYSDVVENLGLQDLAKLKENKKALKKLEKEVDELKSNVYYFIKNLDETSVEASKFYVIILGYLQDLTQSLNFITLQSFNHINNNHKQLKFNQIRDLKNIDLQLQEFLDKVEEMFQQKNFVHLEETLKNKSNLLDFVSELIQKQITRIRTTETSPKNSKLYFGLLLETNDLIKSTFSLLELYKEFYQHAKSKK
ncbi:MAG: inorganic phosphate transporter [Flavobacteriales bacterium]|jgi:phosphate/sulfate permease|nr:inorganic phosphate transporter [Flavobacteriales bacterium]